MRQTSFSKASLMRDDVKVEMPNKTQDSNAFKWGGKLGRGALVEINQNVTTLFATTCNL
jgi:hypothetical protein